MDQTVKDWQGLQITIEKYRTPTIDFQLPNGVLKRYELDPVICNEILLLLQKHKAFYERNDHVLSNG